MGKRLRVAPTERTPAPAIPRVLNSDLLKYIARDIKHAQATLEPELFNAALSLLQSPPAPVAPLPARATGRIMMEAATAQLKRVQLEETQAAPAKAAQAALEASAAQTRAAQASAATAQSVSQQATAKTQYWQAQIQRFGVQSYARHYENQADFQSRSAQVQPSGEALHPVLLEALEAHFNQKLPAIQIHSDASAASRAREVGALAFTSGAGIHFGAGQYQPFTTAGFKLLVHETAHVLQQARGIVPDGIDTDPSLEGAAQLEASRVMNAPSLSTATKPQSSSQQPSSQRIVPQLETAGQWAVHLLNTLKHHGVPRERFAVVAELYSSIPADQQGKAKTLMLGKLNPNSSEHQRLETALVVTPSAKSGISNATRGKPRQPGEMDFFTYLNPLERDIVLPNYKAFPVLSRSDLKTSHRLETGVAPISKTVVPVSRSAARISNIQRSPEPSFALQRQNAQNKPVLQMDSVHRWQQRLNQGEPGKFIHGEPAAKYVVPGTKVNYRLDQPTTVSSPNWKDPRQYQWRVRNDPSSIKGTSRPEYVQGPAKPFWNNATWDFEGNHTLELSIETKIKPGHTFTYVIQYFVEVKTLEKLAGNEQKDLKTNNYTSFRTEVEGQSLQASSYGVKDQSAVSKISSNGSNPARQASYITSSNPPPLYTYSIKPKPTAKSWNWYVEVADWKVMPTGNLYGYKTKTINGKRVYEMHGTGTSANFTIANPNVYTIVCDELNAGGKVINTARYRQVVMNAEQEKAVDAAKKYTQDIDTAIKGIQDSKEVALKAILVEETTANRLPLNLFIGRDAKNPKAFRMVDLTPGAEHRNFTGNTVNAVFDSFNSGNEYPKGRIVLEVPANQLGIPTLKQSIATDGSTSLSTWAARGGMASLGLALTGGALLFTGVGAVAAPYFFVAAGVAGAASGVASIANELNKDHPNPVNIGIDVFMIAGSVLGAGAAAGEIRAGVQASRALGQGATQAERQAAKLASRGQFITTKMGKFLVYTGYSADAGMGVLISAQGVQAIDAIIGDASLSREEKIARVTRILAVLALQAGLLAYGAKNLRGNGTAREMEDMRWQMELKNKKLIASGEPARYPNLEESVQQGMQNLAIARKRGYPYAFSSKEQFEKVSQYIKTTIKALDIPSNGMKIPLNDIAVQGSAVYRSAAHDVDIAILVTREDFEKLIIQSFPNEVARIRQRNLDPFKITMSEAASASEKTLINAISTGIIKRNVLRPKLSKLREELSSMVNREVDLSVVLKGGSFDHGPYIKLSE